MRRKTTYDIILFTILMVLLFLPMLQAHVLLIPLKPLNGVTIETEKPEFELESYRSGAYAKQEEAYRLIWANISAFGSLLSDFTTNTSGAVTRKPTPTT